LRGRDLWVTGLDLSAPLTALLAELEPRPAVHFVDGEAIVSACQAHRAGNLEELPGSPEVLVFAGEALDTETLAELRKIIANVRLPTLVVVPGDPTQRSELREAACAVGALDCLLRDELSTPLLEAAITHARAHAQHISRLHEMRDRFALAIRGAKDGMWEWDLVRSKVFYSQRWRELLSLRSDAIRPTLDTWFTRVHPQDIDPLRSDLDALMKGVIPVHEYEHRIRDGEGTWRWVLSRAVIHRDSEGMALRMAGSMTDITPFRQRERTVRERSRQDELTKLPDSRVFHERIARAVELAQSHQDFEFVVLLVEVDRLSQIRDSYGVEPADRAFVMIAERLRKCLRPEDLLFRYAPAEFGILLENTDDASFGTHVADRIHQCAGKPFELDGVETYSTVSIGMTSSAHGYSSVDEVIADVSAASHTARDRGRNRHEIFNTNMRIEARTLLALEMALRRAIDEDQLTLHYQPIVHSDTGDLIAFEALMRWQHPERGQIPPSEFIPIAENTGLIMTMGRWALRKAVHTLHGWQEEFDRPDLAISVNLSARQVGDPLLLETIDATLAETGLAPNCLKLELTESVMMDRADEVFALLQEIRGRGVSIWIDDFGTGYSSLSYLHRFPVDGLKIDRSFVSRLDGTPRSATLVQTILDLARNFDLEVIAEGIETQTQAEHLQRLSCTTCQGWFFGRPMPADKVRALLGQRSV